jgi:hypothetical protein
MPRLSFVMHQALIHHNRPTRLEISLGKPVVSNNPSYYSFLPLFYSK